MMHFHSEENAELIFERKAVAKVTATSAGGDDSVKAEPVRKGKKIGPNDLCPCGSGKKYKKCCGSPENFIKHII